MDRLKRRESPSGDCSKFPLYAIPIILISCSTRPAACLRLRKRFLNAQPRLITEVSKLEPANLDSGNLSSSFPLGREKGKKDRGRRGRKGKFVGQGVTPFNFFCFSFVYFPNNIKLRMNSRKLNLLLVSVKNKSTDKSSSPTFLTRVF